MKPARTVLAAAILGAVIVGGLALGVMRTVTDDIGIEPYPDIGDSA